MDLNREELWSLVLSGRHDKAMQKLAGSSKHTDGEGNTLYHVAVEQYNALILRWLVRHYHTILAPTTANKKGFTCFHLACQSSEMSSYKVLVEDSGISLEMWTKMVDIQGNTALHIACMAGNHMIARELISKNHADLQHRLNGNRQTALHSSAAGGHISCVRLISQYRKLIDTRDKFGVTALHYAFKSGHKDVAEYLVNRCKAVIDFQASNGMNIVHAAVSSGSVEAVKYALDVTPGVMHIALTSSNNSLLHIAAAVGADDVLSYLAHHQYLTSLVNLPDVDGNTAAHFAAMRNWPKCLHVLIMSYFANIHIKNQIGLTVYGIMANNETKAMRKTFPLLFEKLDSLRFSRSSRGQSSDGNRNQNSKESLPKTQYPPVKSDRLSGVVESFAPDNSSYRNDDESEENWLNIHQSKDGELEIVYL